MLTLGHGRLARDELAALVTDAGIQLVVDVRRYPGSRSNPAAAAGAVEAMLTDCGIGHRHDARLGGRRRLTVAEEATSPDTWWRVDAFRAYAAWTRTDEFSDGLADLLHDVARQRTAIMCSEAVWWRCHRRIISDVVAVGHDLPVEHLMHDGRLTPHPPSPGLRVRSDGVLVWDRPTTPAGP